MVEPKQSPLVHSAALGFAAGFIGLLAYFASVDFYHQSFDVSGIPLVFYQLMRSCFVFYLLWLVYFAGHVVLMRVDGYALLSPLPRLIAAFFTGAGLWHIGLFCLGLLGGYHYGLMVSISVVVMACSLPHLRFVLGSCQRQQFAGAGWNVAAFVLFMLFRGLYPGGGHDYFQHYFYYYQQVVDSGNLGPHAAWYQFFYSKGAGLYFFSMLLTDALAPQLVTVTFMIMANALLHAWLRELKSARVAWAAGTLYWLGLIYTPGYVFSGWAHLEKLHEIMAVLMLGVLWFCWRIFAGGRNRAEVCALLFACVAVVLVQMISAPILVAFFVMLAVWLREWRLGGVLAWAAYVTGAATLLMLAINYFYTGIIFDQKLVPLWSRLDWRKIAEMGAVLDVVMLRIEHERMLGDFVVLSEMPRKLAEYLRIDLWGAVLGLGLLMRFQANGYCVTPRERIFVVVICSLYVVVCVIALLFGRYNWVSFYRLTSFCYAPTLLLAMWAVPWARGAFFAPYARMVRNVMVAAVPTALILLPQQITAPLQRLWTGPVSLASGTFSLRDAYRHQDHFLTHMMPGGAISNGVERVRAIIGPEARLRTLSDPIYCMAPGCNLETMTSIAIGKNAENILVAPPEEAMRILQQAGLNYFFVSSDAYINDILALSSLFAPEHIANYLEVVWTDGTHYLLSWKTGPEALPPEFLQRYRQHIEDSKFLQNYPLARYQALLKTIENLTK